MRFPSLSRAASARSIIALLAASLLSAPAEARQATEAPAGSTPVLESGKDQPDWTLRIEPAAWFAAVEGDIRMPGLAGSVQDGFEFENFDLDEPQWTPVGFAHLRVGDWRFSVGGFSFSTGDQEATLNDSGQLGTITLAAGDRTRSSLDFWSVEAQVAYRLVHKNLGTTQDGSPRLVFGLEPVVGFRTYSADLSVDALSGASAGLGTSADDFFFEPTVAIKLEGEFVRQFTIDVQTGFGIGPWGDTESFSWDITVGAAWRPIPNLGVRIGYRHLMFDLQSGSDSDEFRLDGSVAGLFAGVEIRF